MLAPEILHETARSYGAELILRGGTSVRKPIDPPAAWFEPPKVGDTILVVAAGEGTSPQGNFQDALRAAQGIHHSPAKPDNVTVVAFPNTTSDDKEVAKELDEFIEALDSRLARFGKRIPQLLAPSSHRLVVVPLHTNPFAHTFNSERKPGSHLPVSAIVAPPLDDYWSRQTQMVSGRVGLVQAKPGWENDPAAWETLAAQMRIAEGLWGLESDARNKSFWAVEAMPEPRSIFLRSDLPPDEIVIGSHAQEGRPPVHAFLGGRTTRGIELVTGVFTGDERSRLAEAKEQEGIGVVFFDDANPPEEFVTAVGTRLRRATGLPVETPGARPAGRPPIDLRDSTLWRTARGSGLGPARPVQRR